MSEALPQLARLVGIEDGWWDFFGNFRHVSDETRRAFLGAMGFAVADDAAAAHSLEELQARRLRRWLEPAVVVHEQDGAPIIPIRLPANRENDDIHWVLDEEIGVAHEGWFRGIDLPLIAEEWAEGRQLRRCGLRLPILPPPGYHRLRVSTHDRAEAETMLIVAPPRAYSPEHIRRGGRLWGVQTQIYALRRGRDWGVGDYSGLRHVAECLGHLGAGAVGINPLHALFPSRPQRYSPYSASSRTFLNVAYLDVEAIPDFTECAEAHRMAAAPEFQQALVALRRQDLVDYPGVARCKMPVLEAVYAEFRKRHIDGDRGNAFRRYQAESGRAGELFATFEALQEHFLNQDPHLGCWRHWPEGFRQPDGAGVQDFALRHRERVEFFWYLQWQADAQVASVQSTCDAAGMPIGLYRDVGVGIADDGGESWINQCELVRGVTIGAPPDALAPGGQDWGLTPFNPVALYECGYRPFIEMIRANMRHAGALRLDHAMQLQRLYWVPPGAAADQGAYVRMPARDLFGIVALESTRNRCVVIGEDLGTVPEGFHELLYGSGLYGYRLFVFERGDGGVFKPPAEYTEQALVAFGTHDLPSLAGYWRGTDVAERKRLALYPRLGMDEDEAKARILDRHKLIEALQGAGLLGGDFPQDGDLSAEQMEWLVDAVHTYLNRTGSRILMVQVEDVLGLAMQFNLPGTTDQHPNWRRRYPVDVESFCHHPRLLQTARLLEARRSP